MNRSGSLRDFPTQMRRSLRSLSRGRKSKATQTSSSSNEEPDKNNSGMIQDGASGLGNARRGDDPRRFERPGRDSTTKERGGGAGKPRLKNEGQEPQQEAVKDCTAIASTKVAQTTSPPGAARRGRSRSRVRNLLGRRGSNDGTAESSCGAVGSDDEAAAAAAAAAVSLRGRSRSRLRRLLTLGRDNSEARLNAADPLGLKGTTGRGDKRVGAPASTAEVEADVDADADWAADARPGRQGREFATFRSAVVETLPPEATRGGGVERNASGELTEMSTLQHPPTDPLPIQGGVLAVTNAGRLLQKSVSGLGMEDPVLRAGPRDVDVPSDPTTDEADGNDWEVGTSAPTASDRTATSKFGGGFDRNLFDQLLSRRRDAHYKQSALREATAKEWVRAVHEASPPSNVKVRVEPPVPDAAFAPGAPPLESTTHPEPGASSAPKLDPSRSSRALKSILDQRSSSDKPKRPAASSLANQPLSRSEVEAVLAAMVLHDEKRRSNQPRKNDYDNGANADRWGDPLGATSVHSLFEGAAGAAGRADPFPPRVVVKVRVKRRSTLCAGGGGGVGGAPLHDASPPSHRRASHRVPIAASTAPTTKMATSADSLVPTSRPRGEPREGGGGGRTGSIHPDSAASASAVQELMSRPRRLPDMDSVFAAS